MISVVIPAANEEATIGRVIEECKPYAGELMVIAAGGGKLKDRTAKIAQEHGVQVYYDEGRGKGEAVRLGLKLSKGEVTVFIDADGSHDANDIPKLVRPILEGKAELVIGSRMRGGSDELYGDLNKFLRMLGSDIITLGIDYRFGVQLSDSQNGFRAIKTSVGRQLLLKENITTIEQEMTIKVLKKGYRVIEVPAHEYARQSGESVIKLRKVWFRYVYSWLKYLLF